MKILKVLKVFKNLNEEFKLKKIQLACVYLRNEAIIVDEEDNVFNIINNTIKKIDKLCQKEVIDFAYAYGNVNDTFGYHMIALTKSGRIYGWGMNTYKQVSKSEDKEILIPKKITILDEWNLPERFTQIACGIGHSMALTERNVIIAWGNNCHGQIGNGRRKNVERPFRIIIKKDKKRKEEGKITSVVCGALHSFALFDNGNVYGWGEDKKGQLGLVPNQDRLKPYHMFSNIKQIVSVNLHTLALTYDGILYLMGDNKYGQLGNESETYYRVPIKIDMKFTQIATISGISMGMKEDGQCYIWGLCGDKIITKPQEVTSRSFDEIVALVVGLTYKTLRIPDEQRMQELNEIESTESLLIPNTDYDVEENTVTLRLNEHEKEIDELKERIHLLEQKKRTNLDDNIKSSLIDGLVVVSGNLNISNTNAADKSG
jgi:alpha-tubulin suppressor-like RCC1 family protein